MRARTKPVTLKWYVRAFCAERERWSGASVATILKTDNPDDVVEGVAVCLTSAEVAILDPWESYPTLYDR